MFPLHARSVECLIQRRRKAAQGALVDCLQLETVHGKGNRVADRFIAGDLRVVSVAADGRIRVIGEVAHVRQRNGLPTVKNLCRTGQAALQILPRIGAGEIHFGDQGFLPVAQAVAAVLQNAPEQVRIFAERRIGGKQFLQPVVPDGSNRFPYTGVVRNGGGCLVHHSSYRAGGSGITRVSGVAERGVDIQFALQSHERIACISIAVSQFGSRQCSCLLRQLVQSGDGGIQRRHVRRIGRVVKVLVQDG